MAVVSTVVVLAACGGSASSPATVTTTPVPTTQVTLAPPVGASAHSVVPGNALPRGDVGRCTTTDTDCSESFGVPDGVTVDQIVAWYTTNMPPTQPFRGLSPDPRGFGNKSGTPQFHEFDWCSGQNAVTITIDIETSANASPSEAGKPYILVNETSGAQC